VGFFIHGLEPRGADVCVDLRGHEALVSQQFLNATNVSAAVQQMGCKTVAERVRGGAQVKSGEL